MSVIVEIAEKADVSVEGVVRVLTREPVSDAVQARVLAVLEDLNPEQTRAVQRFALAALHDVLPRPVDARDTPDEVPPDEPLPQPYVSSADAPDQLPSPRRDAALVELSSVLGELAEAVRDLRHETDAERRERVDDLAVLIDLITTGWQGLDGRLGRLERQLSRLESGRPQPVAARPPLAEPAPLEPPPVETPRAPAAPVVASPTVFDPDKRDRLPLAAAATMVGVVIGTLAVLQLFSAGPDVTGLVSARDTPSEAADGAAATGTARATTAAAPTTTTQRATTSSVLGTTVAETRPKPAVKPKPVPAPVTTATTRPATTGAATTGAATTGAATTGSATTTPSQAGFRPTRNWAWAPVNGADYYDVEFRRDGASFYRVSPADAKLTLPSSVVFRPGSYRWVVRPGFGERTARNLGATVVDSPFTVTR